MDDNDELEYVEEDYYAFLNVPRNVGLSFGVFGVGSGLFRNLTFWLRQNLIWECPFVLVVGFAGGDKRRVPDV